MNNQQLITQIEDKINETQQLIINYKQQIEKQEKTLSQFIKQLIEIKKYEKTTNSN